jgi:uncharacterized cupin superfamily protein
MNKTGIVPEAPLKQTDVGLVRGGDGWFVLNAREAGWYRREGRGQVMRFDGEVDFPQYGVNLFVLAPAEPMSMYHWEADQEDFLVLSGEALLIIEGEERQLHQWDFVHCPVGASHVIVGAGDGPCVILAIGGRAHQAGEDWGAYPVDEAARKHGAGVDEETADPERAYARFPAPEPTRYRDGWLPD